MFFKSACWSIFLSLFFISAFSQSTIDTVTVQNPTKEKTVDSLTIKHSPRKATIYSTVLPGLGQAYNKKYWKIPVLYSGFALTGYFIHYNNQRFHKYNDELIARDNNDTASLNPTLVNLDRDAIKSASDDFRRYRDLNVIFTALIYVLNIVDAHVDAHLFYFNVDDNLSLKLSPQIQKLPNHAIVPQLGLKFYF